MNKTLIYGTVTLGLCGLVGAVLWLLAGTEPTWQERERYPGLPRAISEVPGEPIQPIPEELVLDERKIALGEKLFHDPRLSRDNTIACASCHDFEKGGADGMAASIGIGGSETAVNTPTVFNSGFNFVQFWDGRAATLEDQIDGPTHHPGEMGSSWSEIMAKLQEDHDLVTAFAEIYGNGIQSRNIKDAIATYERSLITPNSPLDRFLRGDANAITEREKAGFEIFKSYGCVSCHQGKNVGGNMYQGFGIFGNYFRDRGNVTEADFGRLNVTGKEEDRFVFKVPSLRNVELTAPYFHDGSAASLEEAVKIMAKYQLGRTLSSDEIELLVEFLKTLTGRYKNR